MATVDVGILITAVNRAKGTLRRVDDDLKRLERQSVRTSRGFRAIDAVFASIALGTGIRLSRTVLEVASSLEQARLRVGIFEGSMIAGGKTLRQFREDFRQIPIDTNTLLEAFSRFKAVGIDPMNGGLKNLSEAVLAFGGSSSEFERAVIAIQQIAGKGVASMEELRQQLGEALPSAIQIVSKSLGIEVPQLIKRISEGALGAKTFVDALFEGLKQFEGVGETLGQTLAGSFTRLQKAGEDVIDKVFNEFGLSGRIVLGLNQIIERIQAFTASLTQADVDALVAILQDVIRVGSGAAQALFRVGEMAANVVAVIIAALGTVGSDILVSGFIGTLLFGRAGFLIGTAFAILDRIETKAIELNNSLLAQLAGVGTSILQIGVVGTLLFGKKVGLLIGLLSAVGVAAKKVFELIRDEFNKTQDATSGRRVVLPIPGAPQEEQETTLELIRRKSQEFLSSLSTQTDRNTESLFANQEAVDNLNAAREAALNLLKGLGDRKLEDAVATDAQRKANVAARKEADKLIASLRAQNDLLRISFQIEDQRRGRRFQIFSSSSIDDARDATRQLQEQIGVLNVKIAQARKNMIGASKEQRDVFMEQIAAMKELQGELRRTAEETTASGLLIKETWKAVGDTITNAAKRGLGEFVQGTITAKEFGRDLFNSITQMAADFIVELIKIKVLQAAAFSRGGTGGASGGGGSTFGTIASAAAAFFGGGFANGGLVPGGTGLGTGLVRGPTFFQAGEGGEDEIVAPVPKLARLLESIRQSQGGTNITIQALDTQDAVDVVTSQAGALNNALVGQRNLQKRSV